MFLSGCTARKKREWGAFTTDDVELLDEIGETILPVSANSPGAKAAKIGNFMKVIVTDCYDDNEQSTFLQGLTAFNEFCREQTGKDFLKLAPPDKHKVLVALETEAKTYTAKRKEQDPQHYFVMLKQLTVWGYFTSEPGATKALRFVPIPGRYEGCIPYDGESAWLY